MATQSVAGILAERLGREPDEVRRLVDRFSAGMAAALLGGERLVVDGLGTFSVVHEVATRKTTADGVVFVPPKNRVVFEPFSARQGCLLRIASQRLGMGPDEAAAVTRAFSGVFGELRKRQDAFVLRGFGSFGIAGGRYSFTVDDGLAGLLNTAYEDVEDLSLPASEPSASPFRTFLKPLGIVLALLTILVAVVVVQPEKSVHRGQVERNDALRQSFSQQTDTAGAAPAAIRRDVAAPDSSLLAPGHYTIVVATSSSRRMALEESRRLAGLGHPTRFWKIFSGGDRYYRLVTGDFATAGEARASLRSMPKGLPKHAFIQQASKKVVLYGEHGL